MNWKVLEYTGDIIEPRAYHLMWKYGFDLFIYGGEINERDETMTNMFRYLQIYCFLIRFIKYSFYMKG